MITSGIVAFLVLGALIIVHELGHFLMARMMGVSVEVFSIGFGKTLLKRKLGGTEYRVSMIPLGGYVGILHDGSGNALDSKPVWKQALIAFAGPMANLVFAFFVFSSIYLLGIQTPTTVVKAVTPGSPADRAGINKGDRLLGIGDREFSNWSELVAHIASSAGKPLKLAIQKNNGKNVIATIVPEPATAQNALGEDMIIGKIGITPQMVKADYGAKMAIYLGAKKTAENTYLIYTVLKKMIFSEISSGSLAGPIMILKAAGDNANAGLLPLLAFIAMLSLNLCVFNLLPIPILDGGKLVLLAIESVKGGPLDIGKTEIFYKAGFAIMATLFVYTLYSDIAKLIS